MIRRDCVPLGRSLKKSSKEEDPSEAPRTLAAVVFLEFLISRNSRPMRFNLESVHVLRSRASYINNPCINSNYLG